MTKIGPNLRLLRQTNMYRIKLLVFLTFCLLKGCVGQVLQFGDCAAVETMRYFDLVRFLGKWYEIERFPTWFEDYGQCAYKRIQYCNRRVELQHAFIRDGIQFILHVNSTYNPGDEAVFVIRENSIDPVGIPLSVITTDYTNYAVVYGCKTNEELGIKYILAWILSRNTTLDPDLLRQAHIELNSVPNADVAYLQQVDQRPEKCNYHWTAHVQAVNLNEDQK